LSVKEKPRRKIKKHQKEKIDKKKKIEEELIELKEEVETMVKADGVETIEEIKTAQDSVAKEISKAAVEEISSELEKIYSLYEWVANPENVRWMYWMPSDKEHIDSVSLSLDTGALTLQQVNLMLKHLPVDISFVNEKDEVAYYSDTPERIFPWSAGVIGRKVQNCHPPKSVHIVENILKEFKSGKKDIAEFWIQLGGKFIHIRYFAVRDKQGKYQGTIEVSQDITDIKKLDGEKRLLD